MYGEPSETFKGFTFRPHADWLCFSVEAQGRTIDFAAQQDAEVCSWVVGLTALLREQTKRDASYATNQHGVQARDTSHHIPISDTTSHLHPTSHANQHGVQV